LAVVVPVVTMVVPAVAVVASYIALTHLFLQTVTQLLWVPVAWVIQTTKSQHLMVAALLLRSVLMLRL
jgi:hypothetical protein